MRSEGMLRNSTGTSTARSMSRCPASQSPTAITRATTLSPMLLPPSETIFSQKRFHDLISSRSALRSLAPSIFSVTLPPTINATAPSCSEMTTAMASVRSEEHTSELQSRFDLVCRLLHEKKNGRVQTVQHVHQLHA